MTNEESNFSKQWQLIQCLSGTPKGLSLEELMQKTAWSRRTVQRSLARFRELGIPLIEETGPRGKKLYRIALEPLQIAFTYDEAAAFYIARRFMEPMIGTVLWQAMQSGLKKIRNSVGTQMIRHMERSIGVIEHTGFGWGDYSKSADLVDDLNLAIDEKRRMVILYQAVLDNEPSPTKVAPYGLLFNSGSIYLIGHSHKRNEIRHWKIDRMSGWTITNEKFQVPESFDLAEHVGSMFGAFKCDPGKKPQRVRIRFYADYVKRIRENRWHSTERFIDQPDGTVIMELELEEPSVMQSWLLGFGRFAEVLEPLELRELMLRETQQMSEFYIQRE